MGSGQRLKMAKSESGKKNFQGGEPPRGESPTSPSREKKCKILANFFHAVSKMQNPCEFRKLSARWKKSQPTIFAGTPLLTGPKNGQGDFSPLRLRKARKLPGTVVGGLIRIIVANQALVSETEGEKLIRGKRARASAQWALDGPKLVG